MLRIYLVATCEVVSINRLSRKVFTRFIDVWYNNFTTQSRLNVRQCYDFVVQETTQGTLLAEAFLVGVFVSAAMRRRSAGL